ncbi:MAG: FAD:protein FMN transferase [Paludibacter sp.]
MQYTQKQFADSRQLLYAWFTAMHTRVDLMIFDETAREDLVEIAEKIESEILRIESFTNRFDSDSELSLINKNAFQSEMKVSNEMFQIINECMLYNQQTFGFFDITVNSHNKFRQGAINIQLNPVESSIRYSHPDVQLDVSGFIKGYVMRSVSNILKAENIDNSLVNIGNSSILAIGSHPYGKAWKISRPDSDNNENCELLNECLTTSGNTAKTEWKTIHPLSGNAIEKVEAVSVITDDPVVGEVLSTALYVTNEAESELILKSFKARKVEWKSL